MIGDDAMRGDVVVSMDGVRRGSGAKVIRMVAGENHVVSKIVLDDGEYVCPEGRRDGSRPVSTAEVLRRLIRR